MRVLADKASSNHSSQDDDGSVNWLASKVAMSPSRFAARISRSLGANPMVYVTQRRMNFACRKLVASRQAVDWIAAEAGYESPPPSTLPSRNGGKAARHMAGREWQHENAVTTCQM